MNHIGLLAEDVPPSPPSLSHNNVSAPSVSNSSALSVPSLSRASTAPSTTSKHIKFGQQIFTDTTLDILLQPSQIERSPSHPTSLQNTKAAEEQSEATDHNKVKIIKTLKNNPFNFGISTTIEQELVIRDPIGEDALISLSVGEYLALHRSEALPLAVGDAIEDHGIVETSVVTENINTITVRNKEGTDVKFADVDHENRKWSFTIKSLVPRVANEVWLRQDVPKIKPQLIEGLNKCCICLEQSEDILRNICSRPGELVPSSENEIGCDVACCVECFSDHVANSVSSSKLSIAPVRCPGAMCGRRLPMERWSWAAKKSVDLVEAPPLRSYLANPKALSSFRCPWCDQVEVLFPSPALGETARNGIIQHITSYFDARNDPKKLMNELENVWVKYAKGAISASEMVEFLVHTIPPSEDSVETVLSAMETCPPVPLNDLIDDLLQLVSHNRCYEIRLVFASIGYYHLL